MLTSKGDYECYFLGVQGSVLKVNGSKINLNQTLKNFNTRKA